MKTLEDLWYGNIHPADDMGAYEHNRRKLWDLCERNHNALAPTLNDTQKETLEKLFDLWIEIQQQSQCDAFSIGFRLGVQLMSASAWDSQNR